MVLQREERGIYPHLVTETYPTAGITATASATTHTKGAWAELEAATEIEYAGVILSAYNLTAWNTSASDQRVLIDLGFGAAGSEVVKVDNIEAGGRADFSAILPIRVPAGTRVAYRIQSNVASKAIAVNPRWIPSGSVFGRGFEGCDTFGADTLNSRGLAVPAALNAYGTPVEFSSSLPRAYKAIMWACGTVASTTQPNNDQYHAICLGAAGSEVPIIDGLNVALTSTEGAAERSGGMALPVHLPAGQRLSVKGYGTAATSPRLTLHCFY